MRKPSRRVASFDRGLETLEPRQLLAAVFGQPFQGPEFRSESAPLTRNVVLADVDGDGLQDRITSHGLASGSIGSRSLTLERGVNGGGFASPQVTNLPGIIGEIVAGEFLGDGNGVQIAAVGSYKAAGVPFNGRPTGFVIRVFTFSDGTGKLEATHRKFVPFVDNRRFIETATILSGDLLGGNADEIVVNVNVIAPRTSGHGGPQGRLIAQVFGVGDDDVLRPMRTLMDRALKAPLERYQSKRLQLADINNDGRVDALVRPITTWRAELAPSDVNGPTSLITTPVRLEGTNEAAAGGSIIFTDISRDGVVDRVTVRTTSLISNGPNSNQQMTTSVSLGVEIGRGNLQYFPQTNQDLGVQYTLFPLAGPNGQTYFPRSRFVGGSPGITDAVTTSVVFADLNGDQRTDILLTGRVSMYGQDHRDNPVNVGDQVSFALSILQDSSGGFIPVDDLSRVTDIGAVRYTLLDVNDDGRPDLLAHNVTLGTLANPTGYGVGVQRVNVT